MLTSLDQDESRLSVLISNTNFLAFETFHESFSIYASYTMQNLFSKAIFQGRCYYPSLGTDM